MVTGDYFIIDLIYRAPQIEVARANSRRAAPPRAYNPRNISRINARRRLKVGMSRANIPNQFNRRCVARRDTTLYAEGLISYLSRDEATIKNIEI